jgi:flagellar basal-body rod protein FlgF
MLYGLYVSASGMQAQEQRQDVITNNLANANTNGFKRDLAVVQSRANPAYEDPTLAQYRLGILANQGGGVLLKNGGVDLTQANLQQTGITTDFALQGRGFFVVQGATAGQTALTRDGQFVINNQGTLVTAGSGRPVLSSDGQPITLDPAKPLTVDASGKISQGGGAGAQLKLVDVNDARQLVKLGGNLMTVNDDKTLKDVSPETTIRQGSVELSGVDPIVEMVNMMEGQRAFDANAKLITMQDQTLQQANGIGKVA